MLFRSGEDDDVESLCLDTYENPVALLEAASKKIENFGNEPVAFVCDIKGGSVFNHLLSLCQKPNVTLFSGMNLDLVLSLINIKPKTKEETEEVLGEAKAGILIFNSEILEKMKNENDKDSF